jgi:hypothetical protein
VDAYGDTTTGDNYWLSHQCAANVLSNEQVALYGSLTKASRALGMEVYLVSQVYFDIAVPVVEMGHC